MSAQAPSSVGAGRTTAALLLAILLLATGLRFYALGAQSLWNDEGTSVAVAQRDLPTIARDAGQDIHPPLYYWLLSGWVWLFGTGEAAARSLSALLGVALVALTAALGRRLDGWWTGLAAAFLAAINPLQVYYSQEARMYMLAAVLAAGAALALLGLAGTRPWPALGALVALEVAGLYTHYSFVFVVLVLNLAYLLWLVLQPDRGGRLRRLGIWAASQLAVVVLYLPWLPVAVRQVTRWPSPAQATDLASALAETWRWLVLGPTAQTGPAALSLLLAALAAALGGLSLAAAWSGNRALPRGWSAGLLVLWIGLPWALIFALGLYREAYLKFLLVVAPAVSLLLASGLLATPRPTAEGLAAGNNSRRSRVLTPALRLLQIVSGLALLAATVVSLRNYYTDPAYARDNYRAIAAYIGAVGRTGDAVLLNAPGQQEVFGYYYHGDLPVVPLPESRPLDPVATEAALAELSRPGGRVFAVFWATDESDPERWIEGWLDRNSYKALDSWYGNVRLAVYSLPGQGGVPPSPSDVPDHRLEIPLTNPATGDEIALMGSRLLNGSLAAGDIAQITLFWQAGQTPVRRYKVFLHALDGADQIVGQRDAEPGGGARLTTLWAPGEVVADNHGLPIHPATPPGEYRVEVGLYDAETGQRLTTPDGSTQIWLEPVVVERPSAPAPGAALGMQHSADVRWGALSLLGYDAHKLGFMHEPQEPLRAGDLLHVNLYWRAEAQPDGDWQLALALVDSDGHEWTGVTAEPVGGYPTGRWQAGDVWRGQFNLPIPAETPPGSYRLQVQPLAPAGPALEPFLSQPVRVGP